MNSNIDIKVDNLINKLEKYKGETINRICINDVHICFDLHGVRLIDVLESYDKKDITLYINGQANR